MASLVKAPAALPRISTDLPFGKTLLLGLGNDLLSDDAIGLRVAAELGAHLAAQGIIVAQTTEMGLGLLDIVIGYEKLIIVDAIQTQAVPPGFVHELDPGDLRALPGVSPHFLGVGELLALARELGLDVPALVKIFAVEIEDAFTVSVEMTPHLKAAFPRIVQKVLDYCQTAATCPQPLVGAEPATLPLRTPI